MGKQANLKWKVEVDSTPSSTATFVEVKGLEDVDWGLSEEVQDGFDLSDGGFGWAEVTGGRLNVTFTGKRIDGDAGQDYLVGKFGKWGSERKTTLKLTNTTNADTFDIPCAFELTAIAGGGAVELEDFGVIFHSDGAWTASA